MGPDELITLAPYTLPQPAKAKLLLAALNALTLYHRANCAPYRKLMNVLRQAHEPVEFIDQVPYLPVTLFKTHELMSVPPEQIFKTLTSSGTTSQAVSRIFLDRATAVRQTRALASIMKSFIGPERLPMIVIDSRGVIT